MYVYIKSEPQLYTVGFYAPDGTWHTDSDHETTTEAADRVILLNGGARDDTHRAWLTARMADAINALDAMPHSMFAGIMVDAYILGAMLASCDHLVAFNERLAQLRALSSKLAADAKETCLEHDGAHFRDSPACLLAQERDRQRDRQRRAPGHTLADEDHR